MTEVCHLHQLRDCKRCPERPENNSLTGSAAHGYDGSTDSLMALSGWCTLSEEHAIWAGTDTTTSAGPE